MDRITRLFLWLTIVGPLHMVEQLLTSIEEFYMLRGQAAIVYGWFRPEQADSVTVGLITIAYTTAMLMIYAVLRGGSARRAVLYIHAVFAVTELHHVIEAATHGGYDPGVVTCVPYAVVGWLMLRALRETSREAAPAATMRPPVYTLGR
jgi:hypothetical protein